MNKIFFVVISTLLCSAGVHAAALKISPVSVELVQSQQASSLTIANESPDKTNLQIRIFKWQQQGNEESYISTNDVVVSPPALSLNAQQSYNLRVVRVNQSDVAKEESYRIIIDELPTAVDSRTIGQGINVVLRTSLPLFITNPKSIREAKAQLLHQDGKSIIEVNNIGSRFIQLTSLKLIDETTKQSYPIEINTLNGYILNGNVKTYPLNEKFNYIEKHNYSIQANVNGKDISYQVR
ncbi:fimbrial biogenesis chaperone [Acinetobacter sp. GXMZU3951]